MPRRTLVLAAILLLSMCSAPSISAQDSPLPGIEITCVNEENSLDLEVISGNAQAIAICTIENPSSFNEEIEIEYDGDGLSVAGPESLTLAAGDEQTIAEIIYWERPQGGRVFHTGSIATAWAMYYDEHLSALFKNVLHHFKVDQKNKPRP